MHYCEANNCALREAGGYRVAGIIDEAFNLTMQQNLCDSSILMLVINNYIQYRQYNNKSFHQIENPSSAVFLPIY